VPVKLKGRRNIPKRKIGLEKVSSSVIESDTAIQAAKTGVPGSSDLKTPAITESEYQYLVRDLKWIIVVTGITAVCMVVAYLFFR
jgi:hypothetical protein